MLDIKFVRENPEDVYKRQEEMYLQGASSSLPEDVQNAFYRSIKGFENIEIMRPAYAIEYDLSLIHI